MKLTQPKDHPPTIDKRKLILKFVEFFLLGFTVWALGMAIASLLHGFRLAL